MIDLHTHSTASDGTFSPSQLIESAVRKKLTAIALTDHDTIDGLEEAQKKAGELGIIFIPGIEISVSFDSGELHVLGLGIRHWNNRPELLKSIIKNREIRNARIIKKMQDAGIRVTYEEIQAFAGGTVGRPHFADFLVEQGLAKTIKEAFIHFLSRQGPFYEPRELLSLVEAVDFIHAIGGKAVIAHPLLLHISWETLRQKLPEWKSAGIDGIEAFHSGASMAKSEKLAEDAIRLGLSVSAGSDFHGKNKPGIILGHVDRKWKIPDRYLDFLSE